MPPISFLPALTGLTLGLLISAASAGQETPANANRVCLPTDQNRLQITVTGIHSDKGAITLMLYGDRDEDFLKKGMRLSRIRAPAQKGAITTCIPVPVPGSYAISLYHDEDGNKKLTKNFLGVPIEGYGFSRDAEISYRLPELDETVFTVMPGDTQIHITMRY